MLLFGMCRNTSLRYFWTVQCTQCAEPMNMFVLFCKITFSWFDTGVSLNCCGFDLCVFVPKKCACAMFYASGMSGRGHQVGLR